MAFLNRRISIIGLGYVGLPMAAAFGQGLVKARALERSPALIGENDFNAEEESNSPRVIAFDINLSRVEALRKFQDETGEVSAKDLADAQLFLTTNPEDLKKADFHIVAVPTPVDSANRPDLTPLLSASRTIGAVLKPGDIVVYESTVYPGATEEDCVPVLEKYSGLKCGIDFFVGYSPERINPGDHERSFTKITKIVSGQTPEVLEIVADVYSFVVTAGVYKASSIKVAEAAKVIENTQRDLNIALVNELSMLFHTMDIDTHEVLEAAGSKWNFLPFKPGLVGGHCIGVDPYYLTHKAIMHGYHPEIILAGRRINDGMGQYVAAQTIKQLSKLGADVSKARVGIFGLTFKENCSDVRNTKVIDIYRELLDYGVDVSIHDPLADSHHVFEEYGVMLKSWEQMNNFSAIILAVAHQDYRKLSRSDFAKCLSNQSQPNQIKQDQNKSAGLVMDLKNFFPVGGFGKDITVWRL